MTPEQQETNEAMRWTEQFLMNLLTPQEVANQLKVKPRTVTRLGVPVVRIGAGKGVLRYRQEDVDRYIAQRVTFENDGNRVQKRKKALGIQVLPTRAQLQAIRMGNGS